MHKNAGRPHVIQVTNITDQTINHRKFNYDGLDISQVFGYNYYMKTTHIPYTVDELVTKIYEDNYSHFDFMENMGGEDCDCILHSTMNTISKYMEWDINA